jgi:hypothetical protein
MAGKGASPRPDFDNARCSTSARHVRNALEYLLADKKMLAKFAGQFPV